LHPGVRQAVLSEPPHWKQTFIPFGGTFAVSARLDWSVCARFDWFDPIRSQPVKAITSDAQRPTKSENRQKSEFFCMARLAAFFVPESNELRVDGGTKMETSQNEDEDD
jgi:hypothetical protein